METLIRAPNVVKPLKILENACHEFHELTRNAFILGHARRDA